MSEINNNKDDKEFSFIQEQITKKKMSKRMRRLRSVVWTILLAGLFGIIAAISFCISEPIVSKFFEKNQDKKTFEFPSITPEGSQVTITPPPSVTSALQQNNNPDHNKSDSNNLNSDNKTEDKNTENDPEDVLPEPTVVEKVRTADLSDLTSIYTELKSIASEVNTSIVTVIGFTSVVDMFNDEYESTTTTTGLVVANNGDKLFVIVSLDKIQDANKILVSISESLQIEAKLQNYDNDLNLAILAIIVDDIPDYYQNNIKPASLGESYALVVGTPVLALGCPNGYVGSMEMGIITSRSASVYITDNKIELFNTDIDFNENSAGVIVNLQGEVIGMITTKLKDPLNKAVNSVIGISKIKKTIEDLVNNNNRVYFGIKGADMTTADLKKAEVENGICVTEVEADSPALEAGLQSGDIIVAVNDVPIMSVYSYSNVLLEYEPKEIVKVTVRRNIKNTYKDIELDVVLGKKEGQ